MRVGEVYNNNNYVVIRKLGWGHFSTVWCAWDRCVSREAHPGFIPSRERPHNHFSDFFVHECIAYNNTRHARMCTQIF